MPVVQDSGVRSQSTKRKVWESKPPPPYTASLTRPWLVWPVADGWWAPQSEGECLRPWGRGRLRPGRVCSPLGCRLGNGSTALGWDL